MSRPAPVIDGAAATARADLPAAEASAFDRLASAVLAMPSAPLGATLRSRLPGTAGARWLHAEGLPPATRPVALTPAQWLSLYRCWQSASRPPAGARGRKSAGRPSGAHGHAAGASAIPRYY